MFRAQVPQNRLKALSGSPPNLDPPSSTTLFSASSHLSSTSRPGLVGFFVTIGSLICGPRRQFYLYLFAFFLSVSFFAVLFEAWLWFRHPCQVPLPLSLSSLISCPIITNQGLVLRRSSCPPPGGLCVCSLMSFRNQVLRTSLCNCQLE